MATGIEFLPTSTIRNRIAPTEEDKEWLRSIGNQRWGWAIEPVNTLTHTNQTSLNHAGNRQGRSRKTLRPIVTHDGLIYIAVTKVAKAASSAQPKKRLKTTYG